MWRCVRVFDLRCGWVGFVGLACVCLGACWCGLFWLFALCCFVLFGVCCLVSFRAVSFCLL